MRKVPLTKGPRERQGLTKVPLTKVFEVTKGPRKRQGLPQRPLAKGLAKGLPQRSLTKGLTKGPLTRQALP
jgi:hypothetical protein